MNCKKVASIFLLIMALCLTAVLPAYGDLRTWTGSVDDSWHKADNWDTGLPQSGDDVTIPAGGTPTYSTGTTDLNSFTINGTLNMSAGTLNVSAASSVAEGATVTFSGGILGGSGSVAISGTFNWNGGTMSVANGFSTSGTTTLSGTGDKVLSNNTWTNAGTVNWDDGDFNLSGSSAIFDNNAAFNIETTDFADVVKGTGTFNNNSGGVLNKTYSELIRIQPAAFTNAGTVNVDDGTLTVGGDLKVDSLRVGLNGGTGSASAGGDVVIGASGNLDIGRRTANTAALKGSAEAFRLEDTQRMQQQNLQQKANAILARIAVGIERLLDKDEVVIEEAGPA